MKFKNGDIAKIHSTGSSILDEAIVIVCGTSFVDMQSDVAIYIIENYSGELFYTATGEWKCMTLTEHCLRSLNFGV